MNPGHTILVYIVWFLSTYFVVVLLLALSRNKNRLYDSLSIDTKKLPKVSIVMSAYNEEKTIAASIKSLKSMDYPKELYELIIVNDGSTDKTQSIIKRFANGKNIVFIDNEENQGKPACLNQGIAAAKGDLIACMDADTVLSKDTLKKSVPYFFSDKNIGAVTVSVKVKNAKTFLQKIVQLEYQLGLSLFMRILSFFDCINVTPGPFSIYRKTLLKRIGGFDINNITEDLEIAYRIHKAGYKIANCMDTSVYTTTPTKFSELYRQRKRWYSGALLTFWQHRDMIFRKKFGLFSYFFPFSYALITFGMGLFLLSLYLIVSNTVKNISFFALTNFDFLSYFVFDFDILGLSTMIIFGFSGIIGMFALLIIGLNAMRRSPKKHLSLFFGYFLLFFLYQFFWISSFALVLSRRKLKW